MEGIIDLPFQIVITSELEGSEYATFRALTDQASGVDVRQVIRDGSRETDYAMQEHYRVFLELLAEKNPDVVDKISLQRKSQALFFEI